MLLWRGSWKSVISTMAGCNRARTAGSPPSRSLVGFRSRDGPPYLYAQAARWGANPHWLYVNNLSVEPKCCRLVQDLTHPPFRVERQRPDRSWPPCSSLTPPLFCHLSLIYAVRAAYFTCLLYAFGLPPLQQYLCSPRLAGVYRQPLPSALAISPRHGTDEEHKEGQEQGHSFSGPGVRYHQVKKRPPSHAYRCERISRKWDTISRR